MSLHDGLAAHLVRTGDRARQLLRGTCASRACIWLDTSWVSRAQAWKAEGGETVDTVRQ